MKKYIHFCWFGDKPLPKLAKKCIKSWKKYLPEYEIIKWSENNFDVNQSEFTKSAYKHKKWAFVADYARAKALKEYGGIYFDTDMEITKDISHLFNSDTFLGVEDSGYVAVGVWYEKNKNALLPTELIKTYDELKEISLDNLYDITIPRIISKILRPMGLKCSSDEIQILDKKITIYPREYFYPYSFDRKDNKFNDNTCMIHYYDASWIPFNAKIENNLIKKIGYKNTANLLSTYRKTKSVVKPVLKYSLYPAVIIKRKRDKSKLITTAYLERYNESINNIKKAVNNNVKYITFYNKNWLGVANSTKELFENLIDLPELHTKKNINYIANLIANSNVEQIIFSGYNEGFSDLSKSIKKKNKKLKIKVFWHGSNSQIHENVSFKMNCEIIKLNRIGIIDLVATCKKSLLNFYLSQKVDAVFITNKVNTPNIKKSTNKVDSDEIKIGLYSADSSNFRKNVFTQLAVAKLFDNAVIDVIPLSKEIKNFAKQMDIKITGINKHISREQLMERLSLNDINLYVTFSECAPMLPLESFEVGVPCITGNNHHYFEDNEIEEYIVVNDESNVDEIKSKIEKSLINKEKILKMYKKIKIKNEKECMQDVKHFLER